MTTSAPRLSLPREHGAAITLLGALIGGCLLSPATLPALAAALAFSAAFLARGPLDRVAAGLRPRRWDRAFVVALAIGFVGLVVIVARARPAVAAVLTAAALALVLASVLARCSRLHRAVWLELVAMASLGGTATIIALAGSARFTAALAIGVVLAAHAAASVPLVRSELRADATRASRLAALPPLAAAAALLFAIAPAAVIGLVPRAVHVTLGLGTQPRRLRAALVGARESVLLALTLALLVG